MGKNSKQRSFHKRVDGVTMPIRRKRSRWGRNWPCLCGSNKKYKHCCMDHIQALDSGDQNAIVTPIPEEMIVDIEKLKLKREENND